MTGHLEELALERGRSGLGPAPGRPVEQARNLALVKEDGAVAQALDRLGDVAREQDRRAGGGERAQRSEEHTSELQSQSNLVCRLLLEKKKKKQEQHDRL